MFFDGFFLVVDCFALWAFVLVVHWSSRLSTCFLRVVNLTRASSPSASCSASFSFSLRGIGCFICSHDRLMSFSARLMDSRASSRSSWYCSVFIF